MSLLQGYFLSEVCFNIPQRQKKSTSGSYFQNETEMGNKLLSKQVKAKIHSLDSKVSKVSVQAHSALFAFIVLTL